MEYKVWGKAKAVLTPHKRHYATVGVFIFAVALIVAIVLVARMGQLYAGLFYTGERGPYIQQLGINTAVIRWQSESPVSAKLALFSKMDEKLFEHEEGLVKETHEIKLNNLQPGTRYYYRLYHNEKIYKQGKDYWFETAPKKAVDSQVRIWLLGDPGRSGAAVQLVSSSIQDWLKRNSRAEMSDLNLIISTGDNAYDNGTNKEYQENLFSIFNDYFKNYVFWPVYGNRDARGWSFFKIFTLPAQAELGGVASDTERYYSIDYGKLHLIFLDSNDAAFSADDKMIKWLRKDLQMTDQKWLIAFMHHPPYTRGKHNSNNPKDSGSRMFNMRKRVIPVLEEAGVDMVISGHSHSYERSYLIDCHYGLTSDFRESSKLQPGPVFIKSDKRMSHSGTVYTVLGSSAEAVPGQFDHPAMAVSEATLGSMIIDVETDHITARFINTDAQEADKFVIKKVNAKSNTENHACL